MASFYDEKKQDFYRPRNNVGGLSPERRRRATYILCLLVGAIVTFATINSFGGKKVQSYTYSQHAFDASRYPHILAYSMNYH